MQSTPHTLASLLRRLSLISSLSADDQAAVLALPHHIRSLENAQYVVREGDKPTHSCLVVEGFAKRWLGKSGQRDEWIASLRAARMAAAQEA